MVTFAPTCSGLLVAITFGLFVFFSCIAYLQQKQEEDLIYFFIYTELCDTFIQYMSQQRNNKNMTSRLFILILVLLAQVSVLMAATTLVGFGENMIGSLGDGTYILRNQTVNVFTGGALLGKVVTEVAAGTEHSIVITADGNAFAFGSNQYVLPSDFYIKF